MKFLIVTKKQIMLCLALVVTIAIEGIGSAVTFAQNERKLPIYCVETDKKQVAISFDAAWGNTKKVQNNANPHNYKVFTHSVFPENTDFNTIL